MNLSELGVFLRSRRARITPAEVGLPAGPRRRVPGLRRDEVAQLAGASVDYYIELERGRGTQPSAQMLGALARALRLDHDERDHLYRLADRPPPATTGTSSHVQPAMLALLDRLDTTPARIITDLHETLAQNRLARALLGESPRRTGHAASFVYRWFTEPDVRTVYPEPDHPHHSKVLVHDLRAAVARRGKDPRTADMVARLLHTGPEFTDLWATGDVAVRRGDRKRVNHPTLGTLDIHCQNLFSEDGGQRLQFFTAPAGSPAVDQLRLLGVIGIQDLGEQAPTASGR
ncbi:helix-turn-helix transcriptional regulator [Umezawaea endophytica]|uniref:Helix-turn-helix transcriptional regulator n=1 Tax=Umezawaea endophytica TaxID=1654476 RepID=A0A9X2VMN0_9PSEU|nr:helix-turn-helix transcriptional regulator [Umezawaea endophytica]MCS7479508.1 helix-turn-helix transcriptional regulator [Umezawaea endophytica]